MERQQKHRLLSWILALSVTLSFFAFPRNAHAEIGTVVSETEQAIDTLADTDPTSDTGSKQTNPSQTGSVTSETIPSASNENLNSSDLNQTETGDKSAGQQSDPTEVSQDAPTSESTEVVAESIHTSADTDPDSSEEKATEEGEKLKPFGRTGIAPMALLYSDVHLTDVSLRLTIGGVETTIPDESEFEFDPDGVQAVGLTYSFDIRDTEDNPLVAGDTYSFDLPSFVTIPQPVVNQPLAGAAGSTFSIATDGTVTVTFSEEFSTLEQKEFKINLNADLNTQVFEDERVLEVEIPYSEEDGYSAVLVGKKDNLDQTDTKNGFTYVMNGSDKVPTDHRPTHADWTVRFNEGMNRYNTVSITDQLVGEHSLVENSVQVYRIVRSASGAVIGEELLSATDYTLSTSADGLSLSLNRSPVRDTYELRYTTLLAEGDRGTGTTINNKATINLGDAETEVEHPLDVNWGGDNPSVSKSGSLKNGSINEIDWIVEYNYNEDDLGFDVSLKDTLSDGAIDPSTIIIREVSVDQNGVAQTVKVLSSSDFSYSDGTQTLIIPNSQGKAYEIKYTSTVPDGINGDVTNTVHHTQQPNITDSDSVTVDTTSDASKTGTLSVTEEGIPYILWTVTINEKNINLSDISMNDVFDGSLLVLDWNSFTLTRDGAVVDPGDNFYTISAYTPESGNKEGFTLNIPAPGDSTYILTYITYYTNDGLNADSTVNAADIFFDYGDGDGPGPGPDIPGASVDAPQPGIFKYGEYSPSEDKTKQEIDWYIYFNTGHGKLETPRITDVFDPADLVIVDGTFRIFEEQSGVDLVEGTDYTFTKTNDGFEVQFLDDSKPVTYIIRYSTNAVDTSNDSSTNTATLYWQGQPQSADYTVAKRDPGISKDVVTETKEDGSKVNHWQIDFNNNQHVIYDFELVDTFTPSDVMAFDIVVKEGGVTLTPVTDYTLVENVNGSFTIEMNQLKAVPYTLTYSTPYSPEAEFHGATNKVDIDYRGGSDSASKDAPQPEILVDKKSTALDKTSTPRTISWQIDVNIDVANGYVQLVDAVLEDTIPDDQAYVPGSFKLTRADSAAVVSTADPSFDAAAPETWSIDLPDGPYPYTVTFDTHILRYPSNDTNRNDRYHNEVTLTNQTKNETLASTDSASAYRDYFSGQDNNSPSKTGAQNPDNDNIEWSATVNPKGLPLKNAYILDTLDMQQVYIRDSIVITATDPTDPAFGPVTLVEGTHYSIEFTDATATKPEQFKIQMKQHGDLPKEEDNGVNYTYTVKYDTFLNEDIVGRREVSNTIALVSFDTDKVIERFQRSESAAKWYYGGSGSGVGMALSLVKKDKDSKQPIEGVKFSLYSVTGAGNTETLIANYETSVDGAIEVPGLRGGRYVLREQPSPAYQDVPDVYFRLENRGVGKHNVTLTDNSWANAKDYDFIEDGEMHITFVNEKRKIDVNIDKIWVGGPDEARPTVYFQLWRQYEKDGAQIDEIVPDVDFLELVDGVTNAGWNGLNATDDGGNFYTYYVVEGLLENGVFVPGGHPDYATSSDPMNADGTIEVVNTYIPRVSVGDYVWEDVNRDGLQDESDIPLKGVELTLTDQDGNPVTDVFGNLVGPTTTDDNGFYEFTNLPVTSKGGYYIVTVTTPDGYMPTLANEGDDPAMDSSTNSANSTGLPNGGDHDPTLDFGFVRPYVSVGDYVWEDVNRDGLQDESDIPLKGVELTLTDQDGNPVTDVFGNLVGPTTTDDNGKYEFNYLPVTSKGGYYIVKVTTPDGYIPTLANQGDDPAVDSSTDSERSTALPNHLDNDPTLDFGFVRPYVSVGDYVWEDVNRDGLQDDSDIPLEGVELTLTDQDGNPVTDVFGNLVGPTTTDENGFYEFTYLPVTPEGGHYIVTVTTPDGYMPTLANEGDDPAVDSSTDFERSTELPNHLDNDPTLDFGFVRPYVSVGDYVWEDVNRDGLQDDSDIPLKGVELTLTDQDGNPVTDVFGNVVGPTTTDDNGFYEFTNLPVTPEGGHYIVTVTTPDGYIPTLANEGDDPAVDSSTGSANSTGLPNDGDHDPTLDFGFVRPYVSVGDYVWEDVNRDGLQDDSDIPLKGVELTLTDQDGNPVTDVFGNVVGPTTTDDNGFYEFNYLPVTPEGGHYTVTVTTPDDYIPTLANQGDDPAIDSSTNSADSTALPYHLGNDPTLDFGFVKPMVSVGDYVWEDVNRDGLQDDSDIPLEGVELTLTDQDGNPVTDVFGNLVGPTTTDENGWYEFAHLPVTTENGRYIVTVTTPDGYIPTIDNAGEADVDSDADRGFAVSTALPFDGNHDPTLDFGFVKPMVSVGDYVWIDVNRDGIQDATDIPLKGVVLTLTDQDGNPVTDVFGNVVGPTTTDENGWYEFAHLPVTTENGWYRVTVTTPDGYLPTIDNAGDRDIDSDAQRGYADSVSLVNDGDHDPTLDFGFVKKSDPKPSDDDKLDKDKFGKDKFDKGEGLKPSTLDKGKYKGVTDKSVPRTGENTSRFLFMGLVLLLAGGTAIIKLIRRRRENRENG